MEKIVTPEKTSGVQLWLSFGDSTSMHGVGRAFKSRSPWRRVVWSVLVLCGAGVALNQFIDVVQDYYKYPVKTVVSLKHENQIMFPAITICNINSVKSSMVPNSLKEVIYNFQTATDPLFHNRLDAAVRGLDREVLYKAGHQMSDMLISCWFNRMPCKASSFIEDDVGIYGKCHTFRTDKPEEMYIGKPGPQSGLVIEMSIEHDEYTSLSTQAGVKVVLHESDELPFPEDGGILVQPGMATSISLKKTVTHRCPPPYGECVGADGVSKSTLNLFNYQQWKYTENACRKLCYQLYLYKVCKCCDSDIPCNKEKIFATLGITSDKQIRLCNHTSGDWMCVTEVEDMFLGGELNCSAKCPPACDQTTFDSVVSTAIWPTDPYLKVLMNYANQTVLKNMSFESSDDLNKFIQKNFLRLEIYYAKLDFLEIQTTPMYNWSNLLGDIGGNLGIWLGFSILTGLELLELVFDIVLVCFRRLLGNNMVKKPPAEII